MVVSFMFRYFLLSRLVYVMAIGFACVALTLVRAFFHLLGRRLTSRGIVSTWILLMGWDQGTTSLLDRIRRHSPGTQVIGVLVNDIHGRSGPAGTGGLPIVGIERDIQAVYERTPFDQLILRSHRQGKGGDDSSYLDAMTHALNFCESKGIAVYMVPDLLDVAVRRSEVGSLAGLPFIRLQDSSFHPLYACVKRLMDVCTALAVLLLGMPLWLPISLLIKLTSRGPVLYVQQRAGLRGIPFRMFKFRSMVQGADDMLKTMIDFDGLKEPVFNIRRDPRVTPIGKILRRTSLDEVPQLLNVLVGSMSLVGPRPERLELAGKYTAYQKRRLKAKPGITGYQQVMGRGDPSLAKRIEYDLYYLKYQSLFLDLFIILKTMLVVIRGDGVK
jgi:exopolysaccharide biosynthesis polyprenyl glycosylphosphotransferase